MEQNEIKKGTYLTYAILFAVILILVGITVTYAFFKVQTTDNSTTTTVTATTDCMDISYSETDTIVNLDYNYPISDEFALGDGNLKPVVVTVTNNCTNNIADVSYTLAITSLSNATGFIPNNKIRTNIKRTLNAEAETTLISTNYLSNLTTLTSGTTYDNLMTDLDTRSGASIYTNRSTYLLDNYSIGNNETHTYKVYLWVDYYEGDAAAYTGATHDESYDNSTEGQQFAAAISLIINT